MVASNDQGICTELAAKDDAAKELAWKHYQVETGLTQVFHITDKIEITDKVAVEVIRAKPIKLLEVNENTVPTGVIPLYFGPAPDSGIPYSSVIVEVTPDEFEKIKSKEIKLPDGWVIGDLIPKPNGNGGE